jgi:hypothetical protein
MTPRWTPVEAAVAFAVLGGALAAITPACLRSIRLTRTAEAVENLDKLAVAAAQQSALAPAPLTPATVPQGAAVTDPPGTWDHPTWQALGFALEEPHWYAYRVDVDADPRTPIRIVALGDLDGDGVHSTLQRTLVREGSGFVARPGLTVSNDLE